MAKGERTARLLKVLLLLHRHPKGVTAEEVAEECETKIWTAYRDLNDLKFYTGIPIRKEGTRYRIMEGYILPPVTFNLPEALNIFLAARLTASYSQRYDPNIDSTFAKLSVVVPDPLKEQIQKTIDWLRARRRDEPYLQTLGIVARG